MTNHPQPAPPPPQIIYKKDRHVACRGQGGALGHPVVYYTLDDGEAECGYCDIKYVFDPEKAAD